ncbi:glycosyltransferase family 28 C-terminal domain-containing protein [Fimicolochytrium jonesii]|uniref:glycosyltransferase family 28 C-terminal domain-containing protein n=1 Tax=Fimicolochytrium jonesii TaxID=1396493 RepID=UPI0022FE9A21|nr:glycosyltransferase family 28 C-terminal domain-containing protein [Fimicolochytrium jonesii]KAI8817663.1 glycosyltransferase family 28 C-terminal domain-containing protein [Fimicolochytrium jonesii]
MNARKPAARATARAAAAKAASTSPQHDNAHQPDSPTVTSRIFVTVGTTRFDSLITTVCSHPFLTLLLDLNCSSLTIQHGSSPLCLTTVPGVTPASSPPDTSTDHHFTYTSPTHPTPLAIHTYTYHPTLLPSLTSATLIISHAGAGSILESLALRKPLLVVVNETLMDNHQTELAEALAGMGVVRWTRVEGLVECLGKGGWGAMKALGGREAGRLVRVLDEEAGFELR